MSMAMNGPEAHPGAEHELFQTSIMVTCSLAQYAVTRDGSKFLIIEPRFGSEEDSIGPLRVVRDWRTALRPH